MPYFQREHSAEATRSNRDDAYDQDPMPSQAAPDSIPGMARKQRGASSPLKGRSQRRGKSRGNPQRRSNTLQAKKGSADPQTPETQTPQTRPLAELNPQVAAQVQASTGEDVGAVTVEITDKLQGHRGAAEGKDWIGITPEAQEDNELLAHEAVHIIQARGPKNAEKDAEPTSVEDEAVQGAKAIVASKQFSVQQSTDGQRIFEESTSEEKVIETAAEIPKKAPNITKGLKKKQLEKLVGSRIEIMEKTDKFLYKYIRDNPGYDKQEEVKQLSKEYKSLIKEYRRFMFSSGGTVLYKSNFKKLKLDPKYNELNDKYNELKIGPSIKTSEKPSKPKIIDRTTCSKNLNDLKITSTETNTEMNYTSFKFHRLTADDQKNNKLVRTIEPSCPKMNNDGAKDDAKKEVLKQYGIVTGTNEWKKYYLDGGRKTRDREGSYLKEYSLHAFYNIETHHYCNVKIKPGWSNNSTPKLKRRLKSDKEKKKEKCTM